MYTRSPAAYEALKGFKLLQLPGVRTLKHYIDANLEQAGEVERRLQEKKKQYDSLISLSKQQIEEKVKKSSTEDTSSATKGVLPLGEGAMIIDEVKVCVVFVCSSNYLFHFRLE